MMHQMLMVAEMVQVVHWISWCGGSCYSGRLIPVIAWMVVMMMMLIQQCMRIWMVWMMTEMAG